MTSGDGLSTVKRAILEIRDLRARLDALEAAATEPVAVIGLGCRFPGADGPDAYWRLLHDGVDAIREVPPDRWDMQAFFDPDPDAPGKIYTRHGGFLDRVDGFDAPLFGISPREAISLDPQQRLLLEVAWEAFEHAGLAPDGLSGTRGGVFVGISASDYTWLHADGSAGEIGAYFGTGNALSVAAGRMSYFFGLQGPCMSIDTACSSSLVAIHVACQSLRRDECRFALAGGVNLMLRPEPTVNFCRARMLSPDGRCKAFDAAADGYSRGEGAGLVVLKRLSHALEDGNRVLAVLLGSAVNQDGRTSALTVPNGPSQESLIRDALANARTAPGEVGYIEAHGTGTSLGDPIEMHSLAATVGLGRAADNPVVIGSAKTNLGHLEAAAGIAGLIKVVLSLQHGTIPAHLHFTQLNPHIDTSGFPFVIPTSARPWPAGPSRRVAGVSAFGFSGTNAHVIVAEPPSAAEAAADDTGPQLVVLSARSGEALRSLARRLADAIDDGAAQRLADLAFTAATGRAHLATRTAMVAANLSDLRQSLGSIADGESGLPDALPSLDPPDVAFVFPGAAVDPWPGAAAALALESPAFAGAIERCATALQPICGDRWRRWLEGEEVSTNDQLPRDAAAFALQYAHAALWRTWGVEPAVIGGVGVGAVAAAVVSGLYSLDAAVALLHARAVNADLPGVLARLQAAPPHTLLLAADDGKSLGPTRAAQSSYWQRADATADLVSLCGGLTRQRAAVLMSMGVAPLPVEAQPERAPIVCWPSGLTPREALLTMAARAYEHGVRPDWRALFGRVPARPVALPTYPFERRRYWATDGVTPRAASTSLVHEAAALQSLDVESEASRWLAQLADALPSEREELLLAQVRRHVHAVLRLDESVTVDRRHRLVDLGIDSLIAVELRNRLEMATGLRGRLPATLVFDFPSIDAIVGHLGAELTPALAPAASPTAAIDPAATAAADRVADLSDAEVEALLMERLGRL